jgi:hypothetical protein
MQSGGEPHILDCTSIGFDDTIREASLGHEYSELRTSFASYHDHGQAWSFDELCKHGIYGLLDWYAKRVGSDRDALAANPAMCTLLAFYHRFKIVLENLNYALGRLDHGMHGLFPLAPPRFKTLAEFAAHHSRGPFAAALSILAAADMRELNALRGNLERAVDRTQCMIWFMVQRGGDVPGFAMDGLIEMYAHTPILINLDTTKIPETMDAAFLRAHDIPLRENTNPMKTAECIAGWITFLRTVGPEFPNEKPLYGYTFV